MKKETKLNIESLVKEHVGFETFKEEEIDFVA